MLHMIIMTRKFINVFLGRECIIDMIAHVKIKIACFMHGWENFCVGLN